MESTKLRWKATTVVLPGFLLIIFLISGNSALKCHHFQGITDFDTEGNRRLSVYTPATISTCSNDKNACLQVQLKLNIDRTVVLVSHGDCAHWDLNNGSVSATSGDQHFAIKSNISYCLHDLCNVEMTPVNVSTTPGNVSTTPGEEKVPETSDTNYCYSGFNFDAREHFLEKVRCNKGYSKCYQSTGAIVVGTPKSYNSLVMHIRTCQRPACAVLQSRSFGTVTITIKKDSCCTGSYCNVKEAASPAQNNSESAPANGSYSGGAVNHNTHPDVEDGIAPVPGIDVITSDRHWDTKPIRTPVDAHFENEDPRDGGDGTFPLVIQASGPKGPTLQLCILLVALGITVLGIWW